MITYIFICEHSIGMNAVSIMKYVPYALVLADGGQL